MRNEPEINYAKLHAELPRILKHLEFMAQLHRHKYNALIGQGFTEAQALELCKKVLE